IRDETRRTLTEWEAEQDRLKQEAEAKKKAEQLAAEIEVAHEMALLMNDAFDRDAKAKAEEVERLRKAHEEFIAQQASEKAKREVEEKAKRDIEAAEQRERDAKLAQERAEQTAKDGAAKAERDAKELAERVEREKQDAIAAEKLKAQQEADRVQREAKQKEDARLAEEKRVADEAAKKAADKAHQAEVNNKAIAVLTSAGIDAECAKACVVAIIKNQVSQSLLNQQPPIQINY
ncbi:TPA: cell envelope biogenesis protein TolA, partial [Yersinia enterocolitica]|nr:cell envelope biogenesis protein TolA [Yersinia enterocolitica]HDL6671042.1 cell envelope biogenesis protein TolA [Yersinia enterocolitica]HDL6736003.1 cell envelope biogenesis protein TolA [Yersinia enterocolitica]HDL6766351.1 cell envelope biogenesis protein TolA [Yersinia enterocolitica]HDL8142656.1 cell envelope biogenesis protein TolA [Yersinia enterocolitica]